MYIQGASNHKIEAVIAQVALLPHRVALLQPSDPQVFDHIGTVVAERGQAALCLQVLLRFLPRAMPDLAKRSRRLDRGRGVHLAALQPHYLALLQISIASAFQTNFPLIGSLRRLRHLQYPPDAPGVGERHERPAEVLAFCLVSLTVLLAGVIVLPPSTLLTDRDLDHIPKIGEQLAQEVLDVRRDALEQHRAGGKVERLLGARL